MPASLHSIQFKINKKTVIITSSTISNQRYVAPEDSRSDSCIIIYNAVLYHDHKPGNSITCPVLLHTHFMYVAGVQIAILSNYLTGRWHKGCNVILHKLNIMIPDALCKHFYYGRILLSKLVAGVADVSL